MAGYAPGYSAALAGPTGRIALPALAGIDRFPGAEFGHAAADPGRIRRSSGLMPGPASGSPDRRLGRPAAEAGEDPGGAGQRAIDGGGADDGSRPGLRAALRPSGASGAQGDRSDAESPGAASPGGRSTAAGGAGDRPGHGLRAVRDGGGSAGLFLRRGVSQGAGAEPQGAQQRQAPGAPEDHQARPLDRPPLAVLCGIADDQATRGAPLVRAEEEQGPGAWRQRGGGGDAEAGTGGIRRRPRRDLRSGAAVSRAEHVRDGEF